MEKEVQVTLNCLSSQFKLPALLYYPTSQLLPCSPYFKPSCPHPSRFQRLATRHKSKAFHPETRTDPSVFNVPRNLAFSRSKHHSHDDLFPFRRVSHRPLGTVPHNKKDPWPTHTADTGSPAAQTAAGMAPPSSPHSPRSTPRVPSPAESYNLFHIL